MKIIVVGSGIAGLIAALELAQAHEIILVTKSQLSEANTRYAQGGIAAVMHADDNVAEHIADTPPCRRRPVPPRSRRNPLYRRPRPHPRPHPHRRRL